ncbi:TRAP transporter permease [Thiofilum flexile]|uniref:TRAP transporter permease n=1 Tax=Thiofilum flexile TaxID=125627 RepID=UPI000373CD1B|nr:TRAP transporter permease [Thiofilum flexile]
MSSTPKNSAMTAEELEELVAATDSGARNPSGKVALLISGLAIAWVLFQLWVASPLMSAIPLSLREATGMDFSWMVFNSGKSRAIHLAFALMLVFLCYPFNSRAPRDHVPRYDWIIAILGVLCTLYLIAFEKALTIRIGAPNTIDIIVGVIGIAVLLEATRRALGPPLMIIAMIFLAYCVAGPWMPDLLDHKGFSLQEIVNQQWISSEGVFGVALGVSASVVFLFVLFGSLLEKAGAGNWFIKVAFAYMGHMRGGPAKAAVVSSALTGLISGSSIANVVTTGTFTIPLMRRVGFSPEKAGAVEVASSVNGQIMPPVMGAAAFLMAERLNMPYFDVVKHAFVPAAISYIALVYIVHLEAMKANLLGLPRSWTPPPLLQRVIGFLTGFVMVGILSFAVYYGLGWLKPIMGGYSGWVVAAGLFIAYVVLMKLSLKYPPLVMDDPNKPVVDLPEPKPTIWAGLYYILPMVVLIWCLMVEFMSAGLSAFWASLSLMVVLLTQHPLRALLSGQRDSGAFKRGWNEFISGLIAGSRNMIGIAIATATAGIIVGAVNQTQVGAALADVVEVLSGGHILGILILTAILSLILGMGLPTTANYIVVSALLADVVVELGQANGLIVPLIAVHLFVFYFGIMADVTPPVGLASFAAAGISQGDPMKTGVVAFVYSIRTAILPFLFIFNTDIILWGDHINWFSGIAIFVVATAAILLFTAGTQGWWLARSRLWESVALILIAFTLFRPGFWMDRVSPPYNELSASEVYKVAEQVNPGQAIRLKIEGKDTVGDPFIRYIDFPVGEGATGKDRLAASGVDLVEKEDKSLEVDTVTWGSAAQKQEIEMGFRITEVLQPNDQPSKYWFYLPALALLGFIGWLQIRRRDREAKHV